MKSFGSHRATAVRRRPSAMRRMAATGLPPAGVLFAAALLGCAPTVGWVRADRTCAAADPPRVCFEAAPDAASTLTVGDVRLAQGECAFAPDGGRGSIRVVLTDGATGDQTAKRIGARPGQTVTIDGDLQRTRARCQD